MHFSSFTAKETVIEQVRTYATGLGFHIVKEDTQRPWGGFFVIDESQAPLFIQTFFPNLSQADFAGYEKLSPKFLIVAPHMRLSWQYHNRRAEIWKVIGGKAGIVISDTDEETALQTLPEGTIVQLPKGQRHRLVGLGEWGIVAEIWQHTDPAHLSDEEDIVRVQDDFGR